MNNLNKKLTKEEKKQIKEKILAEKLAKLAKKQNMVQPISNKKKNNTKSTGYDPTPVEAKWKQYWLDNKIYECNIDDNIENNFSIVIPPPNVTGSLHIGHAMMIAIEDSIVRYNRLNGKNVLYLPGLDHAGIATQTVIMNTIARDKPDKLHDKEFLLNAANEWVKLYGGRIIDQFNRLGTSLDFSKQIFTLDNKISLAVNKAFITLYERGLIYRANKIVNWSGKLQTTISDLEVNYKEITKGEYLNVDGKMYQFGVMYYVKYYILRNEDKVKYESLLKNTIINIDDIYKNLPYIIVGTARPETILGDSAICINPTDKRFDDIDGIFYNKCVDDLYNNKVKIDVNDVNSKNKKYIKKNISVLNNNEKQNLYAINPLTYEIIPIIYDSCADLMFGTGILKITPAHDPVDYEIGLRHKLPIKKIMNEKNEIIVSKYYGLKRFECREKIKLLPCIVKIEEIEQTLPFCSRSGDLIEPMIKPQWWLNCTNMAKMAINAVKTNEIQLIPEEMKTIWYKWLGDIRDWCLSRQLWWGHKIPAYKYTINNDEKWIIAESYEKAKNIVFQREGKYLKITQDSDVLDTWFSSGLWPFTTLGWGWDNNNKQCTSLFDNFFPNSILETGSDILFFWVARMVMLSYELIGTKPFNTILLHGIVRDAHGKKMSKSLGNVIDPIFVIDGASQEELISKISINVSNEEKKRAIASIKLDYPNGIPKCGADALRFALLAYTNGVKDINLDILRVAGYSRLCNKIYNAYKFIENKLTNIENIDFNTITKLHNKWILMELNKCIVKQKANFHCYNFMNITQSLHMFFLYSFCDIYIEVVKKSDLIHLNTEDLKVLNYVFISFLKLLHPLMPFISQELYSKIYNDDTKIIKDYPHEIQIDFNNINEFNNIIDLIKILRSEKNVQRIVINKYIEYFTIFLGNKIEIHSMSQNEQCFKTKGIIKYNIFYNN